MNQKQKIYLRISILFVAIGLGLSFFYRPYIYANHINDLGFADVIGSLVSVVAFCCLVWAFKEYPKKAMNQQIMLCTLIYAIGWELLAWLGWHGTFDWKDIIAGLVSGAMTFLIKEKLEKRYSEVVQDTDLKQSIETQG